MIFKSYKMHFKIVRSFSLGFRIHDPKLNGFYVEVDFAFFVLAIWSRGKNKIGFTNYWSKQ